jgi:hypothetical protein
MEKENLIKEIIEKLKGLSVSEAKVILFDVIKEVSKKSVIL